jgi:hypothetical protein
MRRKIFGAIAATALALTFLAPVPSRAVVPVFDAASFAKLFQELLALQQIHGVNVNQLYEEIQTAESLYANGHLNIVVAYQNLTPMLNRIDAEVGNDKRIQALVSILMGQFQGQYPGWTPSTNYGDVMQDYNTNMQKELGQIVQSNAQEMQLDAAQAASQDHNMKTVGQAKGVVDGVNTMAAELNTMEATDVYMHHALTGMINEMATYTAYEMNKDSKGGQQRTDLLLNAFFQNLPASMKTPATPAPHLSTLPRP